jgi:hypothetical protein
MADSSTAQSARSRLVSPSPSPIRQQLLTIPQGVAFYTAIGAATAEILTLATLAVSAIRSVKNQEPAPMLQIRDKKHSISSGSQLPYKPRKRSPSTL